MTSSLKTTHLVQLLSINNHEVQRAREKTMEVTRKVSNHEIAPLVEVCLSLTYFCFQGEIYEQTEGVAMGSPLSPIVANIFMEDFEGKALFVSTKTKMVA